MAMTMPKPHGSAISATKQTERSGDEAGNSIPTTNSIRKIQKEKHLIIIKNACCPVTKFYLASKEKTLSLSNRLINHSFSVNLQTE